VIKTPCETALWYTLPAIRRELARILVEDFKMRQREVAKILGLTEAAVSYYIHKKRGRAVEFDENIKEKIRELAIDIVNGENHSLLSKKVCELCKLASPKISISR